MRLLRKVRELQSELARLESYVHHDSQSFDLDQRPGAVLVDADGRVVVERVEAPVGITDPDPMTRSLLPSWSDRTAIAQVNGYPTR